MFKIASIEISGLKRSEKVLSIPMDDAVNFFIGRNGTGKTRLMNLLNSALSADLRSLASIEFDTINFKFSRPKDRSRPYILVRKSVDEDGDQFVSFDISMSAKGRASTHRFYPGMMHSRWSKPHHTPSWALTPPYYDESPNEVQSLKAEISKLVSLSWISVHRAAMDGLRENERKYESPVDRKLDQVARDFGVYFSTLDKLAAEETDKFQQVYLLSLISPGGYEALAGLEAVNPEDEKAAIRGMFAEFNIKSATYNTKLETFTKRMSKALANYSPNKGVNANDFLVLIDTIRIHDAVKEWHKLLEKRADIYAPKDNFVSLVNSMFYRKRVSISPGNQAYFHGEDGEIIELQSLSSGEKQLFILLGETLLQRQRECVFMADEPEISLHIDWQERLVPSLRKINPNAQIIFATHSPDIVGAFGEKTIDLERLL